MQITKIVAVLSFWVLLFGCTQKPTVTPERAIVSCAELDTFMNAWHQSAASADLESYFGVMDTGFVFLGTDSSERWSKDQFFSFCEPYFSQGKAWDFTPIKRFWAFNSDSTVAWFDESLSTWMKDCRGSGVLTFRDQKWWLQHYNLAVTIENELVQDYLKLKPNGGK